MFYEPVTFSDAVMDSALIINKEDPPPQTRAELHATFTSAVAAALNLQHLKDLKEDAKNIPLKTACKGFRAVGKVNGIPFELHIDGHEAKQFRVVFPEKEQPRIHFCLYSSNRIREWNELANTFGGSPFRLTITPLQGELTEDGEGGGEDDRVYPQREEDGSYPFELAQSREYRTALADATLYALEVAPDEWLEGWEYRAAGGIGAKRIGHRENGQPVDVDEEYIETRAGAFHDAALSLAATLETVAKSGASKKERDQIDAICEWLQPIIEGTAEEPDLADAVAEAVEG